MAEAAWRRSLGISAIIKDFTEGLGGGLRCAVAYGSGAVRQEGYDDGAQPVVDLILGVTNGWVWHEENLGSNGDHYSGVARLLGGRAIGKIQDCCGGHIYYNVKIKHRGVEIKYGVVSIRRLVEDLLLWEDFYLAGRLQKPVGW